MFNKDDLLDNIRKLIALDRIEIASDLITNLKNAQFDEKAIFELEILILLKKSDFKEIEDRIQKYSAKFFLSELLLQNLLEYYSQFNRLNKLLNLFDLCILANNDKDYRIRLNRFYHLIVNKSGKYYDELKLENKIFVPNMPKEGKYVHLIYDSIYCYTFMDFVNNNFDEGEHLFILPKEAHENIETEGKWSNLVTVDVKKDLSFLISNLINAKAIFIHFLFDYICALLYKIEPNCKLVWFYWGGDFYNNVNFDLFEKSTTNLLKSIDYNILGKDEMSMYSILRRATIRNIDYIMLFDKAEYELISKYFYSKMAYQYFVYPNPVNYIEFGEKNKCISNFSKETVGVSKIRILIGNSGNPSNNHIGVLKELSKADKEKFEIIIPLSYGGVESYNREIIKYAQANFPNTVEIISDFLDTESYDQLLSSIDIGIFNHIRQQGIGNIRRLLELEKIVILNPNFVSYNYFIQNEVTVFPISQIRGIIENFPNILDAEKRKRNHLVMEKLFSENQTLESFSKLLNILD